MTSFSPPRFLAWSAALPFESRVAAAVPITRYRGTALGAAASLMLVHPEADQIAAGVWAEIDRLETIFSLYGPESSLSQLNAAGRLVSPPFELLECLSLAGAVHAATGGTSGPTVQPLSAGYAGAA